MGFRTSSNWFTWWQPRRKWGGQFSVAHKTNDSAVFEWSSISAVIRPSTSTSLDERCIYDEEFTHNSLGSTAEKDVLHSVHTTMPRKATSSSIGSSITSSNSWCRWYCRRCCHTTSIGSTSIGSCTTSSIEVRNDSWCRECCSMTSIRTSNVWYEGCHGSGAAESSTSTTIATNTRCSLWSSTLTWREEFVQKFGEKCSIRLCLTMSANNEHFNIFRKMCQDTVDISSIAKVDIINGELRCKCKKNTIEKASTAWKVQIHLPSKTSDECGSWRSRMIVLTQRSRFLPKRWEFKEQYEFVIKFLIIPKYVIVKSSTGVRTHVRWWEWWATFF